MSAETASGNFNFVPLRLCWQRCCPLFITGPFSGARLHSRHPQDGRQRWPPRTGRSRVGQPSRRRCIRRVKCHVVRHGAKTQSDTFYYYHYDQLQAVRSGPWKLFLPLERVRTSPAQPVHEGRSPARLYDVVVDPGEKNNVIAAHAEVGARLTVLAARGREHIGDYEVEGRGVRPAGWIRHPQYQVLKAQP